MSNIPILLLLAGLLAWAIYKTLRRARRGSACCGEHETPPERVLPADRNPAHYPHQLNAAIGGMTCSNCARKVENALNALPDTWARVEYPSGSARILCKQEPDLQALRQAVSGAGYVLMDVHS